MVGLTDAWLAGSLACWLFGWVAWMIDCLVS